MNKKCRIQSRFFFVFLAVIIAFPAFAGRPQASAQEYVPDRTPVQECGDYAYKVYTDGAVEIVEYCGQDADVVIPEELDGNRVTMIGSDAFAYCDLASLTIPAGISVSGRAFQYCTITDALHLPAGIVIGIRAFEYAELPKAVLIPEGAVIGGDSFSYCENLETLFVEPSAILKDSSFDYSRDLKTIVCASGSEIADRAFYSSHRLSEVLLCGDVMLGDKPFPYCENVRLLAAGEEQYAQEAEKVLGTWEKSEKPDVQTRPADQKDDGKIGREEALIIALDDAGVKPARIRNLYVGLAQDEHGMIYEVRFEHGIYDYEYVIDAYTGDVLFAQKAR